MQNSQIPNEIRQPQSPTQKKQEEKKQLQQIYEKQNPYQFTPDMYEICPDLKLFEKLMEFENHIDKMIKRKRFDLQEQFARPLPKLKHVLRLKVTSYFINLENSMDSQNPPNFVIQISGKLLIEDKNNINIIANRKFTSFFNKVEFELDEQVYSHHRDLLGIQPNQPETDGIELKKLGNYESNVLIKLFLNNNPPKYREELADVIGYTSCTRSVALAAIWEYIKIANLQDRENKNEINNDDVFKQMNIGSITARLRDLIEEEEAVEIYHQIKKNQKEIAYYDLIVDVDYPYTLEIMPFLSQKVLIDEKKEQTSHPFISLNQKIKKCEKKSLDCIDRLKSLKFKKDAYLAYQTQPSMFLENILIQQNLLLKIMNKNDEKEQDDPQKLSYFRDHEDKIIKEITKICQEPKQPQPSQTQPNQPLQQPLLTTTPSFGQTQNSNQNIQRQQSGQKYNFRTENAN